MSSFPFFISLSSKIMCFTSQQEERHQREHTEKQKTRRKDRSFETTQKTRKWKQINKSKRSNKHKQTRITYLDSEIFVAFPSSRERERERERGKRSSQRRKKDTCLVISPFSSLSNPLLPLSSPYLSKENTNLILI